jgi:hypothetical protein
MKAIKLIVIGMALLLGSAVQAQFSVNVNFGTPPPWGPVGYTQVRYYYLPDVEAYYDVPSSMFIYYDGGVWVHRSYLPARYKNYNLYGGYKVVMNDYHGITPYTHFKEHKAKYYKGYHGKPQKNIGERPGGNHNYQGGGHDNGKGNGHNNDNHDSHGNNNKKDHGHGDGHGKK